jgi:hypothetical protein
MNKLCNEENQRLQQLIERLNKRITETNLEKQRLQGVINKNRAGLFGVLYRD